MSKTSKNVLAIDLETIADTTMLDIMPEIKVNKNLKDPVKIEADIAAKTKKQIADMGMDPRFNLICCAGWCDENGPKVISIEKEDHASEKKLLIDFWEILAEYDHFVTFNGRAFDLRVMLLHGAVHSIRPSINIDKGHYNRGNHTDLREVYAGSGQYASGDLNFFAKKILGDQKTEGMKGSQVQSYFDMGLHDDIETYCKQDNVITLGLYDRAVIAGLLE